MFMQQVGQFLPEWHPQQAVVLVWPHTHCDWATDLPKIEPVYAQMVEAISQEQEAWIVCYDTNLKTRITAQLQHTSAQIDRVRYFIHPTNDTWVRDYGPLSLRGQDAVELVRFNFNAWGGKYSSAHDRALSAALLASSWTKLYRTRAAPEVFEGGGLETDGAGTLLAVRGCVLDPRRNPGINPVELERRLCAHLGLTRILWLDEVELEGDDTDGHIDNYARFCAPDRIAYVQCTRTDDSHYTQLHALEETLRSFKRADGTAYQFIELPLPSPVRSPAGERLPASYANFLIINNAVLVPTFNVPEDSLALEQLGKAFPERRLIPIDSRALVLQRGGIHCATMQIPTPALIC